MIKRVLTIIGLTLLASATTVASQPDGYTSDITLIAYRATFDGHTCDIASGVIADDVEITLEYWLDDRDNIRTREVNYGMLNTVVLGDVSFVYGHHFVSPYRPCPNLKRERVIVDVDGGTSYLYRSYYYAPRETVDPDNVVYLPAVYSSCERCATIPGYPEGTPQPIVRPPTPTH